MEKRRVLNDARDDLNKDNFNNFLIDIKYRGI